MAGCDPGPEYTRCARCSMFSHPVHTHMPFDQLSSKIWRHYLRGLRLAHSPGSDSHQSPSSDHFSSLEPWWSGKPRKPYTGFKEHSCLYIRFSWNPDSCTLIANVMHIFTGMHINKYSVSTFQAPTTILGTEDTRWISHCLESIFTDLCFQLFSAADSDADSYSAWACPCQIHMKDTHPGLKTKPYLRDCLVRGPLMWMQL